MGAMRREQGGKAPAPGGDEGSIDTLILLDRTVDIVTPMCTQLTYEGLLDEILGLSFGQIRTSTSTASGTAPTPTDTNTSANANRKVSGLTSADPVFYETRDLFYLSARKWLNESLKSIQQFRDAGMTGADISQLKGFVAELRDKFARIPLHTALVEQLGGGVRTPTFTARQKIEAGLLDQQEEVQGIEDAIANGDTLLHVLRMLCLYCAVHGGVPRRRWDQIRRDLLNSYGHEHLSTLRSLAIAGLVHRNDPSSSSSSSTSEQHQFTHTSAVIKDWGVVKSAFSLLMLEGDAVDQENPSDIHFTYAGYAPLSVRIVQAAVSTVGVGSNSTGGSRGWSSQHAAMSAVPGPQFEVLQTVDDKGRPIEQPDKGGGATKTTTTVETTTKRRTVMVMFIGGVTYAEVAALRFLSRKGIVDCDFVIGTTKMVNGNSLMASLLPLSAPSSPAAADV